MILSRKFSEKEVLEIVANYAVESLPGKLRGTVEAKFTKNGIEVCFLEKQVDSNEPSKIN